MTARAKHDGRLVDRKICNLTATYGISAPPRMNMYQCNGCFETWFGNDKTDAQIRDYHWTNCFVVPEHLKAVPNPGKAKTFRHRHQREHIEYAMKHPGVEVTVVYDNKAPRGQRWTYEVQA